MIECLIQLIILLIVLVIVFWIVKLAAQQLGAPPLVVQLSGAVLFLVFLLVVLRHLGCLRGMV